MTVFDLRFGSGLGADRYLFYLAPLVLLGFLCALRRRAAGPAGRCSCRPSLVAAGFALAAAVPGYAMLAHQLPVSCIDDYLRRGAHSLNGARAVLVVATVVLIAALRRCATFIIRRRSLRRVLAVLTLVALPLETAYAFTRLFDVQRHVGPAAHARPGHRLRLGRPHGRARRRVTMRPLPAACRGDYLASVA